MTRFCFTNVLLLFGFLVVCSGQTLRPVNDSVNKKVVFGNEKMRVTLDYKGRASISSLVINGQEVIDGRGGVYTETRTKAAVYSTLHLLSDPVVKIAGNTVLVGGIVYGDKEHAIRERWTFTVAAESIRMEVDRNLSGDILVEQAAMPAFLFNRIDVWDGAYQDYGGLAWFYLFDKRSDTYGVHSSTSKFWNSKTGNGLRVAVEAPGKQVAMVYSRTQDDQLAYSIQVDEREMIPRSDSGTQRRRYIRDSTNVWASFAAQSGKTHQSISLSYFDFNKEYGRGKLVGIDQGQVSAVLNTIARIGVIDKQHFGGNSWHTPYGPICLHEQYIAQMGLGINDPDYLKGYQQCLDFYRDNAIKPDGRVWPRWAYSNEDMMPGEVTDKGFYEAQWGYLLDANPDLVTNVAELYDQTGDLAWVKTHQRSCEHALDWICGRDSNGNRLVEMMMDSHLQKRGSDWIDIIWASFENAFVNAKLYHALVLWAGVERQLGDTVKAGRYADFAARLKVSFNKPLSEGGFWDGEHGCYVHWRDKDGSVHGRNMVTPVNFMAIGYGICDDDNRRKAILDTIESQMQKEKLFFWPLCLYSYGPGEGNDWQFPFPNYENGDIFLSWGALGVKAYADYKPAVALRYVKNVLAQYAKDGLAFQRYGRLQQNGLGDDILSGNSLSIVGLYQAIYGINPLYNRFYINPHLTSELSGTQLFYYFRGQKLVIGLGMDSYSVSDGRCSIRDSKDFGFYSRPGVLQYFNRDSRAVSLEIETRSALAVDIKAWGRDRMSWGQSVPVVGKLLYRVGGCKPGSDYAVWVNGKLLRRVKAGADGRLRFDYVVGKADQFVILPV